MDRKTYYTVIVELGESADDIEAAMLVRTFQKQTDNYFRLPESDRYESILDALSIISEGEDHVNYGIFYSKENSYV